MANSGIAPPNLDTSIGLVRVLLGDTDADNIVSGSGEYLWYSDTEIAALLSVFGGNVLRTGAQALRTVATSQSLLLKKWSADDLTVDGPAITRALTAAAERMDEQADAAVAATDIFELSYPGSTNLYWPEGMPALVGRLAPDFGLPPYTGGSGYTQDGGLLYD